MKKSVLAPEWAREFIREWGIIRYQKKVYLYVLLSKDFLEGRLPNFVDFVPYPRFLYLSEEIPQEYRKIVLRYELRKNLRYRNGWGSARRSLAAEMREVSTFLKKKGYIEWRLRFFQGYYWYYTNVVYDEAIVWEIQVCIFLLEKMLERSETRK